jgi:acylphosphatase
MPGEENLRLHATVSGRVQGVSFRYFVVDQAMNLDLTGWTRNLWNGSVEVMAEGQREKLENLLQALREGPPMARVEDVDFKWLPYEEEFKDFSVKPTV